MPLVGLNRAFVKQGLKTLAMRKNIGLRTLADKAAIDSKPSCYHLGFILGPRINAGGRVGESYIGSKLLSSNCEIESLELAGKLEEFNEQRKYIESTILVQDAINMAAMQADDN
jgi:single-stranded-DNA-specific exonuclease